MSPSCEHQLLSVLYDHLQRLSLAQTSPSISKDAADRLAYATALVFIEDLPQGHAPGGLGTEHLGNTGPLSTQTIQRLSDELDQDLLDVADFYYAGSGLSQDELRDKAEDVAGDIEKEQATQRETVKDISLVVERILELVEQTNEIHPRLQESLALILKTYPPILRANRSIYHDLLSLTIETALLKLSLMRSTTATSLYNYTPSADAASSQPSRTVSQTLARIHARLSERKLQMDAEEAALDERLESYTRLIKLVDGPQGGFAQVVEDWARVQKETAECRRDLRRLGWTG
ncbi:hypothetical protein BOTBODRAFT_126892 [Botryobasidium botryosum FD-172 SS1]|uniref:Uncharacterized protein n=1 Tax=Botryobasidium botryosum (strain FD-172 SS1) TaxID=930990 RepID=A0A067MWE8_BOTB1|nr:hypothetical protein BOTBODRAFT_126892 [Botryobasidium botryosum FD-172 SS1]